MESNVSWLNRFEIKPGRWVYCPNDETRVYGKKILKITLRRWNIPPYYFHLLKGGHVQALTKHMNSEYFATIDLKDFFGSVSRTRITRALKPICGYDLAREIAKRSTIKALSEKYPHSHHLPYGFVQSPLLASISLFDSTLGKLLHKLYGSHNVIVSVYMDDIVISSRNKENLIHIFDEILMATKKSKFNINEIKTLPVAASVTAFNIELSHGLLQVTESRFQKFSSIYSESNSEQQKQGIAGYVGSINRHQAKLLV